MRMMLDATMVKPGQAGIRRYAMSLAPCLASLPDTELIVVVPATNSDDWGAATVVRTGLSRQGPYARAAWRQANLPRLAAAHGVDALLVPAPEPIRLSGIRQGIVVHDLGPLLAPGVYGRRRHLLYAATLRRSLQRADAVFTPSAATKLDVVRWAGPTGTPVTVAGPELVPSPDTGNGSGETRGDFALYVGALLPHKNVETVIDAFVSGRRQPEGTPSRLVIVGPSYGPEVARAMARASGSSAVEHRGFVSEDELDALYRSAAVVVLPSLFEGFGLPLLEALGRRAPVVASDIPALREVGGPDVTYVRDPMDPHAWRAAMVDAAGRAPATREPGELSWAACARTIRDALAGPRPRVAG